MSMVGQEVQVGMMSGARYKIEEIFLCEEAQLRKAQALRAATAQSLVGVSTGIGFWGSPEWALSGTLALGILEGIASNATAKKGMAQLEEANQLSAAAQREGTFVPVSDIRNITAPHPGSWIAVLKSTRKAYAHSGESFITVRTSEEGVICLAWDKVESFIAPKPIQPSDKQLMEQYGITFDGAQYCYEMHRYDKLSDAIGFAQTEYARLSRL
ncbi:MAG TPA: hypothetical protein VIE91_02035 [Methylophilaceae bacterium]|jgi:hypothetical protein